MVQKSVLYKTKCSYQPKYKVANSTNQNSAKPQTPNQNRQTTKSNPANPKYQIHTNQIQKQHQTTHHHKAHQNTNVNYKIKPNTTKYKTQIK